MSAEADIIDRFPTSGNREPEFHIFGRRTVFLLFRKDLNSLNELIRQFLLVYIRQIIISLPKLQNKLIDSIPCNLLVLEITDHPLDFLKAFLKSLYLIMQPDVILYRVISELISILLKYFPNLQEEFPDSIHRCAFSFSDLPQWHALWLHGQPLKLCVREA